MVSGPQADRREGERPVSWLEESARLRQHIVNIFGHRRRIEEYRPSMLEVPPAMIDVRTAWQGLERVIPDIIKRFNVGSSCCIEFGVEYGYSTVVFSNYFEQVVGVDTFEGDVHTTDHGDHYERTSSSLEQFRNISLHKADYKDWIRQDQRHYDLAHVDIVHTYEDTYRCGLWAATHSRVTLFHDTDSFVDVRNAVIDIARDTGKRLYNYPRFHGLGVMVPHDAI